MEASNNKSASSAKQLKEHLQDQQEPFSLHNYLSEKRFFLKNFSSHHIIDDHYHYHLPSSEKTLKWRITYERHRIRKRFLHASSILRSLLYKFISFGDEGDDQNHHKLSTTNWVAIDDAASEDDRYTIEDGEDFHSYNPKLVNMFHSFTLPELRRIQVDAVAKPNWISTVEKQWEQPLANSVCEFKSDAGPETTIYTLSQKSEAEPFLSSYLPKLLLNPNILKFRRPQRDKLHRSKRAHQAGKAREFKESKGKRRGKIWLLEKQYWREAQKITHLLYAESCVVSEEWTKLHRPSREIHFEIGDAIMDDILREMLSILLNN